MQNPSYYHGTQRPWTAYDLSKSQSEAGRFVAASEFNKIGLWLTNQPGHARFYGDQIIKFDLEIEKPFKIARQGAYQPFAEGLYFHDIAKKTIPMEDRVVIEECLSGHRALWEDPKTISLFVKASEEGAWGFGSGKHNRERYKRVRNEMLMRDVWEKTYRDWLQNADYWKAVRDMLVASGYDAVVFEDSVIDLGPNDPHHDVIVYLHPEKLAGSPMESLQNPPNDALVDEIHRAVEKFHEAEHWDENEDCHVAGRPDWNHEAPTGVCTNSATWIMTELGRGKVVGYTHDLNETAKAGEAEGGHDFLVVDDLIVDVWLADIYNGPLITRLDDKKAVHQWYGDPDTWEEIETDKYVAAIKRGDF